MYGKYKDFSTDKALIYLRSTQNELKETLEKLKIEEALLDNLIHKKIEEIKCKTRSYRFDLHDPILEHRLKLVAKKMEGEK